MSGSVWSIVAATFLVPAAEPMGYLVPRGVSPAQAVPYQPREGDLIFYDDHKLIWNVLFAYAGTGSPLHAGIVVKRADGRLAVLEAGPDDTVWVDLIDLRQRLEKFVGTVTIRRCKKELSKEQSLALSRFAILQEGKCYAVLRLLLQGTWLRPRGPLGLLYARTYLDRDSWICSELAVAASVVAGLLDRNA